MVLTMFRCTGAHKTSKNKNAAMHHTHLASRSQLSDVECVVGSATLETSF